MALILSIETSTKVCSVALYKGEKLIGLYELHIEKSHSSVLTVFIESLIKVSGYKFDQLDAIAVSKGPGSYTGLRIGVSTAKGLAYSLNKPLIGINTLEAMSSELSSLLVNNSIALPLAHLPIAPLPIFPLLCPMIDARRMEVYFMLLDRFNQTIIHTKAEVITSDFLKEYKENPIICIGDGVSKCEGVLKNWNFVLMTGRYPSAKAIGKLAYPAYHKGIFEKIDEFEPYYLKEFVSNRTVEQSNSRTIEHNKTN